jgi:ubiquinone/menaquinone biosynthesis C-methylase UbiE
MKNAESFFDFAAQVGLTKHLGGQTATRELIERCQITADSYVLDVGCGVGITPRYLAKTIGCRVVGVDINPKMILRAGEMSLREDLTHLLEFRTGDAQELPFKNNTFDAVITESVTVFPEDTAKAVREYVRVTVPGGHVGLNEATWLTIPIPAEVKDWASQNLGGAVNPLLPEEWVALLDNARLKDIFSRVSPISIAEESRGILERYGWGGVLRTLGRTLKLYLKNPAYRKFVRSLRQKGVTPPGLEEYFGFGIYVGRKG